jgi:hypothetical protein
VINLPDLDLASLKQLLDTTLANREAIRRDLQSIVNGFQESRLVMIDLLRNSVNMM